MTALAPVKLVPLTVTAVPPPAGPFVGARRMTVGAGGGGVTYVKWSAALMALVPPGVVTLTSAVPEPAGLVAVIWVGVSTENAVAATVPNLTADALVKLVPVIGTDVPAATGR